MLSGSRNLLLRADASESMGTGHVMRAIALAEEWIEQDGRVEFFGECSNAALLDRMKAVGIACDCIRNDDSSVDAADFLRERISDLCSGNVIFRPWVLFDGYQFGAEDQEIAASAGARVIFMDDFCHAERYSADIVLNQNAYALPGDYSARSPDTTVLAGSRYVVLRGEFAQLERSRSSFEAAPANVLITFGGADPGNVTLRALDGIASLGHSSISARVLIGAANSSGSAIRQKAAETPFACEVLTDVKNMAEQLMWADLAVSSAGTTSWEMAYCGVPAIMITIADNQLKVADSMELNGAGLNLGPSEMVSPEMIGEAVVRLLENPERRKEMSFNGMRLVDGEGGKRIVAQMMRKQLVLRNAVPEDKRWIWHLANEPEVRAASFSSEKIGWEEHEQWYAARMADEKIVFLVVESDRGQSLGYVRFTVEGVKAVVSVALQKSARGLGLGSAVIELGTRHLLESTGVQRVEAQIKEGNEASERAFAAAGYIREDACVLNCVEAIRMIFAREAGIE